MRKRTERDNLFILFMVLLIFFLLSNFQELSNLLTGASVIETSEESSISQSLGGKVIAASIKFVSANAWVGWLVLIAGIILTVYGVRSYWGRRKARGKGGH